MSFKGVVEPVVVGVNEQGSTPESEVTVGSAVGEAVGAGTTGASIGGVLGPIGAAVGAVIGALASAFKSIANATRTTPDDARRYLYEIGYEPGKTLKTARVTQDATPSAKLAIRRGRYVDLADKKNYGLDEVNFWLERAGETTGHQADNPMPVDTYLDLMADAFIEYEYEQLLTGQGDAEVPLKPAPLLVKSVDPNDLGAAAPLHRAVMRRLRAEPDRVLRTVELLRDPLAQVRGILQLTPEQEAQVRLWSMGAPEAFRAWVAAVQVRAGDRGPNPVDAPLAALRDPLRGFDWWLLGGGAVLAAGIGGAAMLGSSKGGAKVSNDILSQVQLGGESSKSGVLLAALAITAGVGVVGWLLLGGGPSVGDVLKAAPTERVLKGYIGQEVVQNGVKMMVGPDGKLWPILKDANSQRVVFGLVGKRLSIEGSDYVVQVDGALKKV
jgi:hypothetical protein